MYIAPRTVGSRPADSRAVATRRFMASAALSVNVNATMLVGSAPFATSHAILKPSVVDFPEPAHAKQSTSRAASVAAARCSSFRFCRRTSSMFGMSSGPNQMHRTGFEGLKELTYFIGVSSYELRW